MLRKSYGGHWLWLNFYAENWSGLMECCMVQGLPPGSSRFFYNFRVILRPLLQAKCNLFPLWRNWAISFCLLVEGVHSSGRCRWEIGDIKMSGMGMTKSHLGLLIPIGRSPGAAKALVGSRGRAPLGGSGGEAPQTPDNFLILYSKWLPLLTVKKMHSLVFVLLNL